MICHNNFLCTASGFAMMNVRSVCCIVAFCGCWTDGVGEAEWVV